MHSLQVLVGQMGWSLFLDHRHVIFDLTTMPKTLQECISKYPLYRDRRNDRSAIYWLRDTVRTAMPSLPPQFSSVKWACGSHTPLFTVLVSAASAIHTQLPSENINQETTEGNTRSFRLWTIQGCVMKSLFFSLQRIHTVWATRPALHSLFG